MFRLQLLKYRYLSIIKEEGLDISQPALDPESSEVHHHLTTRKNGSRIHRFNFFLQESLLLDLFKQQQQQQQKRKLSFGGFIIVLLLTSNSCLPCQTCCR
jgi:hypothetical protein